MKKLFFFFFIWSDENLILKAGHLGGGCWVENGNQMKDHPGIGCCTTGVGELLIKNICAQQVVEALKTCEHSDEAIEHIFKQILNQPPLATPKLFGIVSIKVKDGQLQLLWGHTTRSLAFSYQSHLHPKANVEISYLKDPSKEGKTYVIGGSSFKYQRNES